MSQREEALQRTEKEILAEKAATLGRAGERLEAALALVAERRQALARVIDGAARAVALASYREAIGLRNHRIVDQQFPEPPALV